MAFYTPDAVVPDEGMRDFCAVAGKGGAYVIARDTISSGKLKGDARFAKVFESGRVVVYRVNDAMLSSPDVQQELPR